jgi:hypothetical protein
LGRKILGLPVISSFGFVFYRASLYSDVNVLGDLQFLFYGWYQFLAIDRFGGSEDPPDAFDVDGLAGIGFFYIKRYSYLMRCSPRVLDPLLRVRMACLVGRW